MNTTYFWLFANWHINLQTMFRKFEIKTSIMVVVPPQRKAKSGTRPLTKSVALEVAIFLGQNCHDLPQFPEKKNVLLQINSY
jgi:hypothetical protein